MPILEREIDIFPDDLLTRESEGDTDCCWWAVYTRSRQEKELMRGLRALDISFYCPIIAHRNRSPAGRVRTSYIPLFSNYLFMYGDGFARYRALQTNLISTTIEVVDGRQLADDLRQIRRLIDLGVPLTVESRLQPGTPVRIKHGSMAGITGVILKREGQSHLLVAVNFLQQGASLKLEDFLVEEVD